MVLARSTRNEGDSSARACADAPISGNIAHVIDHDVPSTLIRSSGVRSAARLTVSMLAAALLSGCSGTTSPAPTSSSARSTPATAEAWCQSGFHRIPQDNISVEKAVIVSLEDVRAWVVKQGVNWDTFSESLAATPPEEDVAVCVSTQKNGDQFTPAPGVGSPPPAPAVLTIVTLDGGATAFKYGDAGSLAAEVARQFDA